MKKHQLDVLRKMGDSYIIIHGTGTGKTLTALMASHNYLKKYPNNRIVVVSPASLTSNFIKESIKHNIPITTNYSFYSFDKFIKTNKTICSNSFLIIDEAHNLRNMGERFRALFECCMKCDKLLLLTATPFVNSLEDFVPIIQLLNRNNKKVIRTMPLRYAFQYELLYEDALETIGEQLKGRMSFMKSEIKYRIHKVEMNMSYEFYNKYKRALQNKEFGNNPEKFYHGYRRAVNSIGGYMNEKLEKVKNIVSKGGRTIIFSNWIENGVDILTDFLKNYTLRVISGNTKNRMDIVEAYNKGLFQVLIITKAGSEGLDLGKTDNIIILDPVWNPATLEQIIGRGTRVHNHTVDVYLLVLKSPGIPSGDELLYNILESKNIIKKSVEKILEKFSD